MEDEFLVNRERGCLSGPSFAFLLVNCREKKKRKKKEENLYAGAPVSSLLRVYKSFCVSRKKQREKKEVEKKHESSIALADSSCSCLTLAESRRPHAPCDSLT